MKKTFYIKVRNPLPEDKQSLNESKIGGLPTHRPKEFPKYLNGTEKGFVMQIYWSEEKFPGISDVLCWHIYQDIEEEDEPILVEIPFGAKLNDKNEGTVIERLEEKIIYYVEGVEPDILEVAEPGLSEEEERYYSSKIGGGTPEEYIDYDKEFLGCIYESVGGNYSLCFGGKLNLLKNKDGKLEIEIY